MTFVNLHVHTSYSLGASLIEPAELLARAKELNQPAVAITDLNSLAALYDGLQASKKQGVKLIAGCAFNFVEDFSQETAKFRHIILLAKNHQGYKNLLQLNKNSYDHALIAFKKVNPRIDWTLLEKYSGDLICLTGGGTGILGSLISNRKTEEADQTTQRLLKIFGNNLGLEVQANNMKRPASNYNDWIDQTFINTQTIQLAKKYNIRVVPTSAANYLVPEHFEALDVFLAIAYKQPVFSNSRPRFTSNDFYLKDEEKIRSFFARHYPQDVQEWIDNTSFFASQCEDPHWVLPSYSNNTGTELPDFPVSDQLDYVDFLIWQDRYANSSELPSCFQFNPAQHKLDGIYLRYWSWKEFNQKFSQLTEEQKKPYYDQITEEISVFEYRQICSYILIVADYIDFCRKNHIPFGLGRGSVGGSLIAYLIGIHAADPIKYSLIFERFYNREKKDFSDIDCDFSQAGKGQVEEYIAQKYGQGNVAQISNFLRLTPKLLVRAIARAFQFGGDQKKAVQIGNDLAALIPIEVKTVKDALASIPLLAVYAERYPQLSQFGPILDNRILNLAKHAGGIVISKRPLVEIMPTRRDKDGNLVLEHEKERTEKHGLQKMDILGVSSLDIVDQTIKIIKGRGKELRDWRTYDDPATYDLISSGDTFGVFQLGTSSGTIALCKKVKPRNILDIAQVNALTRPGFPQETRDDFIKAKDGETPVEIFHPSLERAFRETYGFALFEESLLFLAQDVAGWSKLESDRLRKLVKDKGKHPEIIPQFRKEFIESGELKGAGKDVATQIWDQVIAPAGAYQFNKSHAIFYSFLGYQTAFLKQHYPIEFLVCNLNFESRSTAPNAKENILQFKNELRSRGVSVLPPDLNKSSMEYTIESDSIVRMGLGSLKYVSPDAISEIVAKRPFSSLDDFLSRTDGKKLRAPAVAALAAAGCLDEFGLTRKQLFFYVGDYKKKLQVWNKKKRSEPLPYPWPEEGEFSMSEKHSLEKLYLGEGMSGTLVEIYPRFFTPSAVNFNTLPSRYPAEEVERNRKFIAGKWSGLKIKEDVQAVLQDYFEFRVKKADSKLVNKIVARITLTDPYGNNLSGIIFPQALDLFKKKLETLNIKKIEPGVVLRLGCEPSWYGDTFGFIVTYLYNAAPPPALPADVKPKNLTISLPRASKKNAKPTPEEVMEEMDDELDLEGLSSDQDDIFQYDDIYLPQGSL